MPVSTIKPMLGLGVRSIVQVLALKRVDAVAPGDVKADRVMAVELVLFGLDRVGRERAQEKGRTVVICKRDTFDRAISQRQV